MTTESDTNFDKEEREFELMIKDVMSRQSGRQFVSWLLSKTCQRSSITHTDPLTMAAQSGRRDVGLEVSSVIESLDPDNFDQMLKEARHGSARSSDHSDE